MIVPTLAIAIDALAIEADEFVDPYQGGDDEFMCLCDYRVCQCAGAMNGTVVRVARASAVADDDFSDMPF